MSTMMDRGLIDSMKFSTHETKRKEKVKKSLQSCEIRTRTLILLKTNNKSQEYV